CRCSPPSPALFQSARLSSLPGRTRRGPLVRSGRLPSASHLLADPSVTIRRSPAVGQLRFVPSLSARACPLRPFPSAHFLWQPTVSPCLRPRIPSRVYRHAVLSAPPPRSREVHAFRFA